MVRISTAPCCWGVDDPKNPHLPPWQKVLDEAGAKATSFARFRVGA